MTIRQGVKDTNRRTIHPLYPTQPTCTSFEPKQKNKKKQKNKEEGVKGFLD